MAAASAHGYGLVDDKLVKATQECLDTGSIMPMLKEELRCTIQNRRLAEGKTELTVQFTPPTEQQLNAEEIIKKENRREQNRRAARKFRQKQATLSQNFQKRIEQLEAENRRLTTQVKRLSNEKSYLQGKLHANRSVCGDCARCS
ncbi:cyclic AMP-dependent transcription factor ATF-3-like isoform X2 [Mizuhopecten yessoensis]|nr:cyclic AMP-dependent transcription factor ATF-3-like isoform X2 [Mizuhopecten yessoensis]XP_021359924.1 cyclic AMP-dependent transcription factor ATF-3-like isoform X2 [Mizuhopecten yessoensis]